MTWEFYEVWAEDDDGHEELVETTKSRSEAFDLAKKALDEGEYASTVVYQENPDGDLITIERFYAD